MHSDSIVHPSPQTDPTLPVRTFTANTLGACQLLWSIPGVHVSLILDFLRLLLGDPLSFPFVSLLVGCVGFATGLI